MKTILLDNGHSAGPAYLPMNQVTPGKRSPVWSDMPQLFEGDFNRTLVERIYDKLEECGIPAVILVPEVTDIALSERTRRANTYGNDTLFISVHANAFDKESANGWEVWTSPGETESDRLAEYLFQAAERILTPHGIKMRYDRSDGDSDKESRFTVLMKTSMPAVLTENCFYTNKRECAFMQSEEGLDALAEVHVRGIIDYLTAIGEL